jgi:predicted NAD/FAD-binding protein
MRRTYLRAVLHQQVALHIVEVAAGAKQPLHVDDAHVCRHAVEATRLQHVHALLPCHAIVQQLHLLQELKPTPNELLRAGTTSAMAGVIHKQGLTPARRTGSNLVGNYIVQFHKELLIGEITRSSEGLPTVKTWSSWP